MVYPHRLQFPPRQDELLPLPEEETCYAKWGSPGNTRILGFFPADDEIFFVYASLDTK